ncbi:hypothetical protein [Cypionkella sp.]|uniref:hypothetical protein n=1 Tax=Cypionkella sp. TaxID=2811411 RepID=UPI0027222A93|nr:hypothetical protein [Cypionkella sp.]MDO8982178.1 hypothetical protein [Cypionkella sp.]MDP1575932.1 hypothetical protein [Cypionkella sp.]MDP2048589.1 hypothetical protein [Cypionkella sp.]
MKRIIQPALLLATLAFAAAPAFTPPFRGYDPGTFPVQIANPSVQPAGYAFAIWGLIYLWLIAHAAYGLIKRRGDPAFVKPAVPLTLSVLLGTVWLAIAVAAPIPAAVAIIAMAALAVYAYVIADPAQDPWFLSAPLAIYAGWLTAASAVSTGVILAGYGILPDTTAALTMLGIVLIIAIAMQIKGPDLPIYGATIVWAIVGIVVKSWGTNPTVAYAALAGAVVMALVTLAQLRRPTVR